MRLVTVLNANVSYGAPTDLHGYLKGLKVNTTHLVTEA